MEGQESVSECKNHDGAMDLRRNMEDGGSEECTGKEDHSKPMRAQDENMTVPNSLEGGHEMQDEEIGGVDQVSSGK